MERIGTSEMLRVGDIELRGEQLDRFTICTYSLTLPKYILQALYHFADSGAQFTSSEFEGKVRELYGEPTPQTNEGLRYGEAFVAHSMVRDGMLTSLGLLESHQDGFERIYQAAERVAKIREIADRIPIPNDEVRQFRNFPRRQTVLLNKAHLAFISFMNGGTSIEPDTNKRNLLNSITPQLLKRDLSHTNRRGGSRFALTDEGKKYKDFFLKLAEIVRAEPNLI